MSFKSRAQQRYFLANKAKLEKQGVDVNEWQKATGDRRLPERIGKRKDSSDTLKRIMTRKKS